MTASSVEKTFTPVLATDSKLCTVSSGCSTSTQGSSSGATFGRSRLLNCNTIGTWSSGRFCFWRFCSRLRKLANVFFHFVPLGIRDEDHAVDAS